MSGTFKALVIDPATREISTRELHMRDAVGCIAGQPAGEIVIPATDDSPALEALVGAPSSAHVFQIGDHVIAGTAVLYSRMLDGGVVDVSRSLEWARAHVRFECDEYNGHPSRAHWNVCLWLYNDQLLYEYMRAAIRRSATVDAAARDICSSLYVRRGVTPTTPDGVPFSRASVAYAIEDEWHAIKPSKVGEAAEHS